MPINGSRRLPLVWIINHRSRERKKVLRHVLKKLVSKKESGERQDLRSDQHTLKTIAPVYIDRLQESIPYAETQEVTKPARSAAENFMALVSECTE